MWLTAVMQSINLILFIALPFNEWYYKTDKPNLAEHGERSRLPEAKVSLLSAERTKSSRDVKEMLQVIRNLVNKTDYTGICITRVFFISVKLCLNKCRIYKQGQVFWFPFVVWAGLARLQQFMWTAKQVESIGQNGIIRSSEMCYSLHCYVWAH